MERNVADITAVLQHFGGRPVLAGAWTGAYVALLARDAHPHLVRRLVLVDGGLPLPISDGVDPDTALEAVVGPAITRLRRTFPSTEAYLDLWRARPALAGHWNADVEAYVRYDLTGEADRLRSRTVEDAVRADNRDQLLAGKPFAEALGRLTKPTPLLVAPAGLAGEPPGLMPAELVAEWQERVPPLRPQLVPDVNHYTIMFDKQAAAAIARAMTTVAV